MHDAIVAIERTGDYHRAAYRTFRQAGVDIRLVDPLCTHHFRQPAHPDAKTDETDLAAIHRAVANGFGLIEGILPEEFHHLRLRARHRRDLRSDHRRLIKRSGVLPSCTNVAPR